MPPKAAALRAGDRVGTLVVDTAPLLTGAGLASLDVGTYVTVAEVLAEVRDSWARRNLEFATPFELKVRAPSEEAMKTVMSFARKTGDFPSLSLTDLKVLALTYMLDREAHGGTAHLRMEPPRANGAVTVHVGGQVVSRPSGPARPRPAAAADQEDHGAAPSTTEDETAAGSEDQGAADGAAAAALIGVPAPTIAATGTDQLAAVGTAAAGPAENPAPRVSPAALGRAQALMAGVPADIIDATSAGDLAELWMEVTLGAGMRPRPVQMGQAAADGAEAVVAGEAAQEDAGEAQGTEGEQAGEAVGSADASAEEGSNESGEDSEEEEREEDGELAGAEASANGGSADAAAEEDSGESDSESSKGSGEEDDDDGGGWITPKNVARHKAKDMGVLAGASQREPEDVKVALITSDFAMQNVVMQMNLRLLSVDGMLIRRVKTWVLRCHACFKITSDMEKKFCPSCGNNTLMRASCQIGDDGSMKIFLKKNFQYNNRGTKYSIPTPKGGKKAAQDLILAEDDPNYQRALREHRRMLKKAASSGADPFSPEFVPSFLQGAGGSTSGAPRGVDLSGPRIGYGRSNPNEVKRSTGNRKKRR
ncbi:Nin one binding Zn-ribbon like-domain-containing protein [Hyaloraphidium curvatum]|nr:Nin one binding Zn-ribbon like-domain-containing protein [Hyaloraphidium curvatum]